MKHFYIITGTGYWGTGNSFSEAAKNSNVTAKFVKASVFIINSEVADGFESDDFGAVKLLLKDKVRNEVPDKFWCHYSISLYGEIKTIKGEPIFKIE